MTPLFVHVFHVVWCPFRLFSDPASAEAVDLEMTWPSQWYFSLMDVEHPKMRSPLNWFRLCQAFEDSWAGNRGCRNSHGEVVPWYLHPDFFSTKFGVKRKKWIDESLFRHPRQASSALDAFLFRRAAHAATGRSAAMLAKELYVVPRVVRAAAKCARPIWKVPQFYEVKLPRC